MELVSDSYNKRASFLKKVIGTGDKFFETLVFDRGQMVDYLLSRSPQLVSDKLVTNNYNKQDNRSYKTTNN